jgi:hypothetical protein
MPTSLPDKNDNAKPKYFEQARAILRTRRLGICGIAVRPWQALDT